MDTYNNTKIKNIARGWQAALRSFIIDRRKHPSTTVFQWRFKLVSPNAAITIGIMEHIKDKPLNIDDYIYILEWIDFVMYGLRDIIALHLRLTMVTVIPMQDLMMKLLIEMVMIMI